jgi:RNA 2',3'-cyclic 3'-phosphodiesterase
MSDDTPRPSRPKSGGKRQKFRKERPAPETIDTDWRLFLAVPMPEPVRARIGELIARLEPRGWPVRWIDPDNAHLTLHFLGDTPPEQAAILQLALPAIVARHEAFDLRTAGLGVFPKLRRPRVIWLGVWGPAHRLEAISSELGEMLEEMQFPVDQKPFSPHVTLARVRDTQNTSVRSLTEALRGAIDEMAAEGLADPKDGLPLPIDEVRLIRSHLDPAGARYEVIARFPLAPREGGL